MLPKVQCSPLLAPLPAGGLVWCSRWAHPIHPGGRSGWTGGRSWCCSWHWCCFGAGTRLGTSRWDCCCSCCCWERCSPACGACSYSSPESHFHPPQCPWTEKGEISPTSASARNSLRGSSPRLSWGRLGNRLFVSCPLCSQSSQSHRSVWAGRALKAHTAPAPAMGMTREGSKGFQKRAVQVHPSNKSSMASCISCLNTDIQCHLRCLEASKTSAQSWECGTGPLENPRSSEKQLEVSLDATGKPRMAPDTGQRATGTSPGHLPGRVSPPMGKSELQCSSRTHKKPRLRPLNATSPKARREGEGGKR